MSIIDKSRKIEITVQRVDSIPCSLVGKKMVFSADGAIETEPWQLPWPMPWIESVCRTFAMENIGVSQTKSARLYNPDEPDQYIEILAKSYVDLTIGQLADQVSELYGEREALISSTSSRRYTYGQFREFSGKLAKGLISIGLQKSDKVAVWAVNSPEFVLAQFAIAKAGGIMVPLNAYEKEMRMETLLRHSDTSTLIMQVGTKATENIEILYRLCPELCEAVPGRLRSERFPMLKNVIVISDEEYPGTYRWSELLQMGSTVDDTELSHRQKQLSYEDTVHMIYTSGTTGTPKGVMLNSANVIENANAMADRMELTEKDVMCVQAPMFHCFGCVACILTAVSRGGAMVMVDKFRPEITMSLIEREKCTVVSGVPTMFIGFIHEMEKNCYDFSSVRTGIIAGASCPPKLMEDIQNLLGIPKLVSSYGLTEASPCVTAVYADDPLEWKSTAAGAPIPGVQVRIMDSTTKEEVTDGSCGEIWVKGYNLMQGYYCMPDETAKAIDADGWLHTGDIGCLADNGYLSIKDRSKDIIIRSGENISPKEIEDFLHTHDAVAEAAVVGVSSYLYGEEVVAFIRVKDDRNLTENEIREYCRGKISTNKMPRWVVFLDRFPVSDSGKCLKSELRRHAAELKEKKIIS
ncbi:AMP-binding protein [Anoxybacterium hadale]|uniref:AMP-binding protein n=1 Tax=Anoxybacterium hadale TaxID=3408580 RepID=A0ACD1A9U9_9FIRM|nr:AMP-binding protein [Clostridiales bacterium]